MRECFAMNNKLPTLLVAFTLAGIFLVSTLITLTASSKGLQDPPADDIAFEEAQTAKLLGVPLQKFPGPQGLNGMDEIPATARPFTFTVQSQRVSGPPPRVYFQTIRRLSRGFRH